MTEGVELGGMYGPRPPWLRCNEPTVPPGRVPAGPKAERELASCMPSIGLDEGEPVGELRYE